MKPEKAIEILQLNKGLEEALEVMEPTDITEGYVAAVDLAIAALERQIPKQSREVRNEELQEAIDYFKALVDRLGDAENAVCVTALKALEKQIPRKLTLDELRQMDGQPAEIVCCKDCRLKDTQLCRASRSIKYDPRREKYTYKTLMEPDGFCSIGERDRPPGGEK